MLSIIRKLIFQPFVFLLAFGYSVSSLNPLFGQEEEIGLQRAAEKFQDNKKAITVSLSRDETYLKLGGALRFHYNYIKINSGKAGELVDRSERSRSQMVFDTFLLNFLVNHKSFYFNLQYRFLPDFNGGNMPVYGYIGYHINPHHELKAGFLIKTFGIPSSYHGWANTAPNFVGLEEGGGLGLSYNYNHKNIEMDVMFLKNSYSRALQTDLKRFTYQTFGEEEDTQLDFRFIYHFDKDKPRNIGFSAEVGGLLDNSNVTGKLKDQDQILYGYQIPGNNYYLLGTKNNKDKYSTKFAAAVHGEYTVNKVNIRLQYGYFDFESSAKKTLYAKEGNDFVQISDISGIGFGAFNDGYIVHPKGHFGLAGIGYEFNIKKGMLLTGLDIFNDFSFLTKGNTWDSKTTLSNVFGMNINLGAFIIRPEWMLGVNHLWFNGDFVKVLYTGNPKPSAIDHRLNIHFGFYF